MESYTQFIYEYWLPIAARCGIGYSEFWNMTPRALSVYKKQQEDREREVAVMQDISAWMNGFYVLKAIGCVLSKKASYPEKHMIVGNEHSEELTEDELEEIIDQNTQIAAANFAAWANRANNTDSR